MEIFPCVINLHRALLGVRSAGGFPRFYCISIFYVLMNEIIAFFSVILVRCRPVLDRGQRFRRPGRWESRIRMYVELFPRSQAMRGLPSPDSRPASRISLEADRLASRPTHPIFLALPDFESCIKSFGVHRMRVRV